MPAAAKKAQEIWEAATSGTTWVNVRDPRNPDGWVRKKVGGKGTRRITVTVEEREFNQELVPFEKKHTDPFANGMLLRISPKEGKRGENEMSDEQLIDLLAISDDALFEKSLNEIQSEVLIRRLLKLAEKHTSMLRYQAVQEVVDTRYHIGKTSKVAREIMEDDARYADADF